MYVCMYLSLYLIYIFKINLPFEKPSNIVALLTVYLAIQGPERKRKQRNPSSLLPDTFLCQ